MDGGPDAALDLETKRMLAPFHTDGFVRCGKSRLAVDVDHARVVSAIWAAYCKTLCEAVVRSDRTRDACSG